MTDESQNPEPAGEETSPNEGTETMAGGGDFSSGEGLVAFAGIVLLANYVIFEVIFGEYFISYVLLLLAVAAALLPRLRRESVEAVLPLGTLMKVIGYGITILGVFEIVDDVRFDGYDDFGSIIAALAAYAGYAMAFLGARSIKN